MKICTCSIDEKQVQLLSVEDFRSKVITKYRYNSTAEAIKVEKENISRNKSTANEHPVDCRGSDRFNLQRSGESGDGGVKGHVC